MIFKSFFNYDKIVIGKLNMKKREDKVNYLLLWVFFSLGYFFGFLLVPIFLYPIIKYNEKYLTDSMRSGMICGFVVSVLLIILLSI